MFAYFITVLILFNIAATGYNVFRAFEKPPVTYRRKAAKHLAFATVFGLCTALMMVLAVLNLNC